MLVFGLVFFPISMPENWPHNLSMEEAKKALQTINFTPLNNTGIFSPEPVNRNSVRDIIINLLMTVPIGLTIPYLTSIQKKSILPLAIGIGLLFESLQLIIKLLTGTFYHTVDINDVIMNMLGVLVGYMIFTVFQYSFQKRRIHEHPEGKI